MDKEKLTALVNRAKTGDQQAMEYLLRYAHTTVSYQCSKFLKNEQDAEDMTQEVLLTVYEKLDRLEQPAAFIPWVNRIAATRCINAINRAHPEYQFAEDEEGHSVLDNLEEMDAQRVPDKALDNKETARMIEEIVDSLPAPQRLCTYLFYYDQLSVKEIARLTQTSENTVKSRLNYARKAIKEDVLDYEKQGIKLYSLSPLPFLLYFLRRSAAYSADPVAAKAAAQAVVSGSAATVAAGSSATDSSRSSGKYAKSSHNTKAAKSVPAGKAAAKTSGALSGMATKIAAGVAAVAVTVGGVGYAVSHTNGQEATEPVSTQAYVAVETTAAQSDTVTETTIPVTEAAETTEATIAAEPYTMLRTTIDTTGYDCEMFLETPQFAQTTDVYKKINAFFEDMRDDFLNGKDENVAFMFERLETQEYAAYAYTQTCKVRCQTEYFVSVSLTSYFYAGGVSSIQYSNYTFDTQTGELLELTDLINGTEEEIAEFIVETIIAEQGESYFEIAPKDYDSFVFYIEDNRIWVRPLSVGMATAFLPYVALPGELT